MNLNSTKTIWRKPIMWFAYMAVIWAIIGIGSGIFFDFFTLAYQFDNIANISQLGVLHTHSLVLGFLVSVIFLLLEMTIKLSKRPRLFISFFVIYYVGVFLVWAFMVLRGVDTVINYGDGTNFQFIVPAFITTLPHVILTIGLALFLILFILQLKSYLAQKALLKKMKEQQLQQPQ